MFWMLVDPTRLVKRHERFAAREDIVTKQFA